MAWFFDKVLKSNISNLNDMLFDGRDIWALSDSSITILNYWDESTEYEFNLYGGYTPNIQSPNRTLTIVDTININDGRHIKRIYDTIYVPISLNSQGDFDTITKIDRNTHQILGDITLPFIARCNPATQGNNIWLVERGQLDDEGNDTQLLWKLDTTNETYTSSTIPGRKNFHEVDIEWTYDNFILVAGYNQSSILKFDLNGVHISTTPTNRKPRDIYVNPDRNVYIASINGMITDYNYSTDAVANDYTSVDNGVSIIDLDGWFWTVTDVGGVTKTKQTTTYTDNIQLIEDGDENYKISATQFDGGNFKQVIVTPEITYQIWNGTSFDTRTVSPYVVFRTDNGIRAVRYSLMSRKYTMSVLMTGMIATGQQNYYGETE